MPPLKYAVEDRVKIHEGEGKGKFGYVVSEFTANFDRQYLDICLEGVTMKGWDPSTKPIRKRASDVERA